MKQVRLPKRQHQFQRPFSKRERPEPKSWLTRSSETLNLKKEEEHKDE